MPPGACKWPTSQRPPALKHELTIPLDKQCFPISSLTKAFPHPYDSTSGGFASRGRGTGELRNPTRTCNRKPFGTGATIETPMHSLAAEKNSFRFPATSGSLTDAVPRPRLDRRLSRIPSIQTPKNSAFINVLARSRTGATIRTLTDYGNHQPLKYSAFINVLARSRTGTVFSNLKTRCFVRRTLPATLILLR